MRKPANLIYGLEDAPPLGVTVLLGLQHLAVVLIYLIIPTVVAQAAGASPAAIGQVIEMALIALGVGVLLQVMPRGPLGSGYLCPPVCTAAYLSPALLAAKTGGLPLAFGMTVVAGLFEAALSRLIPRLRVIFAPAVTGFVVLMIGLSIELLAAQKFLAIDQPRAGIARELLAAGLTLAIMAGLTIWSRGPLRLFCALIGMVAGYLFAGWLGLISPENLTRLREAPVVEWPHFQLPRGSFNAALLVPFLIGSLAAAIKAVGTITTAQKISDADWRRPDLSSIDRGVLADAAGTVVAGLVGSVGMNTSPSSVGLSSATGATSRRIGYALGGLLILLAFFPKVATVFAIMPEPVMGAGLVFTGSFVIASGLQVLTTHPLDARKTLVIGISLMLGTSRVMFPAVYAHVPPALHPFVQSDLSIEIATALLLTLLFRIGIGRRTTLTVPRDATAPEAARSFLETQRSAWNGPKPAFDRAGSATASALPVLAAAAQAEDPIILKVTFDDLDLRVELSYRGPRPEIPADRFGADGAEVVSENGASRLRLRIDA
jgi:NCS2 family nucleobase:cation symporter-2